MKKGMTLKFVRYMGVACSFTTEVTQTTIEYFTVTDPMDTSKTLTIPYDSKAYQYHELSGNESHYNQLKELIMERYHTYDEQQQFLTDTSVVERAKELEFLISEIRRMEGGIS